MLLYLIRKGVGQFSERLDFRFLEIVGVFSIEDGGIGFLFLLWVEAVDIKELITCFLMKEAFFFVEYIEIIVVFHGESLFSTFLLRFKILQQRITLQLTV